MKKQCSKCKEQKPLSDFYADNRYKYGVVGVCKTCQSIRAKQYRKKNYNDIREKEKQRYSANRDKATIAMQEYNRRNWVSILERKKIYNSKLRREDPVYREKMYLRSRIRRAFNLKGEVNSCSLEKILGCSCKCFYKHVLSTWYDKYGKEWNGEVCEIDHIKPLSQAKSVEGVRKSFHYSNLQLLTPDDNREKSTFLV